MAKLIVAFSAFAKAPKNASSNINRIQHAKQTVQPHTTALHAEPAIPITCSDVSKILR